MNRNEPGLPRKKGIAIVLFAYMGPYAYLIMLQDYQDPSRFGWMCLLVGCVTVLFALMARAFDSMYLVGVGNVLSTAFSYRLVQSIPGSRWETFFEPFQPHQALWIYAGGLLAVQIVALLAAHLLARRGNGRKSTSE